MKVEFKRKERDEPKTGQKAGLTEATWDWSAHDDLARALHTRKYSLSWTCILLLRHIFCDMAGRLPTSGRPNVPNPTTLGARSSLRPPIYNPYDKFTAQEFDAWIGDITGQLRRALGQEPPRTASQTQATDPGVSMSDEEVGEDAFAEIKARRAAKGKQRATYEELDEDEVTVAPLRCRIVIGISAILRRALSATRKPHDIH